MAAQNTNTGDNGVTFIRALADFLSDYADKADGGKGAVEPPFEPTPEEEQTKTPAKKTTARKTAASSKTKAAAEEPEADVDPREKRKAELKKQRITSLRKIAKETGHFEEDDIADADKDDLIDALLDDEFGDDEDGAADEPDANEDDDDAADEASDEPTEYTEATLKKMNLKELRRIAVEEKNAEKEDVADADKAEIIDFILSEDDADDEGEDDEESYLTEDDLKKMDLPELKTTAKEYGIKPPLGIKKPALIDLILAQGDDGDE